MNAVGRRYRAHRRARPRCCCSAPAATRRRRCRSAWSRGWRTFRASEIERPAARPVTQYRGQLMPLVPLSDTLDAERRDASRCWCSADGDRSMGLMVDEIVDVVEDRLDIELSRRPARPARHRGDRRPATDVLDTGYWLTQAWQDWFAQRPAGRDAPARPPAGRRGQRLLPPAAGPDARRGRLPGDRGRKRRRGAARCARPAGASMRSSRTSRCRTWTGSPSPAASREAGAWARPAADRAQRPRRAGRRAGGPRGRLHRLRREIRARGAAAEPAPVPRPPRRAVRGLNGVTDMNQIVEQPTAERALRLRHGGGKRVRHPDTRRPALRRAGAGGARHPRRAADHAHPAGAAGDRRQPQPARPHRHRDRPAPAPASRAAARRARRACRWSPSRAASSTRCWSTR